MNKTMTRQQRKLVEDNHSLIYYMLRQMQESIDEYYDLAAIALCKAAVSWQAEKGAFTSYACQCIKNEILRDYRAKMMQKRQLNEYLISYDAPVLTQDGDEISLLEQIRSLESVENEALSHVMYTELIDQLGKADSKMLKFFERGLKQREIAEIMGVTQANVSRVKRRVKKMLSCD